MTRRSASGAEVVIATTSELASREAVLVLLRIT